MESVLAPIFKTVLLVINLRSIINTANTTNTFPNL